MCNNTYDMLSECTCVWEVVLPGQFLSLVLFLAAAVKHSLAVKLKVLQLNG